jgi:hypothetical protein
MYNGSTILLCVIIFVIHKQCLIRAHCSIVTVIYRRQHFLPAAINEVDGLRHWNVAMPILGITRIEKSVTRGRQNNTSHACQRLSQHESRASKAVTTRVTSGEATSDECCDSL